MAAKSAKHQLRMYSRFAQTLMSSFIRPRPEVHSIASDEEFVDSVGQEVLAEQSPLMGARTEEQEEIDNLPQNQKTVLFTNSSDFQQILTNNNITHEDLIFQLFFRDKYNDTVKRAVEEQPNDISKKIFLLGIIKGLIDENDWSVQFDATSRKQKLAEWVRFKKSNMQQSSSSSSGIGGAIAEGAREGAKAVAKATVAKGGEMLVRRAFGV